MTVQPSDVYELLRKIRYDATAIQAKVTDAMKALNELHLEDVPAVTCPHCGVPLAGERTLAEHLYVSHNGEIPSHYLDLDARLAPQEAHAERDIGLAIRTCAAEAREAKSV